MFRVLLHSGVVEIQYHLSRNTFTENNANNIKACVNSPNSKEASAVSLGRLAAFQSLLIPPSITLVSFLLSIRACQDRHPPSLSWHARPSTYLYCHIKTEGKKTPRRVASRATLFLYPSPRTPVNLVPRAVGLSEKISVALQQDKVLIDTDINSRAEPRPIIDNIKDKRGAAIFLLHCSFAVHLLDLTIHILHMFCVLVF